jgi:hypothetical protein
MCTRRGTAAVLVATGAGLLGVAAPAARAQTYVPEVVFLDGFEVVVPAVGALRITEVMANPGPPLVDSTSEWIELRNAAPRSEVLTDCALWDGSGAMAPLSGLALAPGEMVVAARSLDNAANGGLGAAVTFGFTINDNGEVLEIRCGGVVVDQVNDPDSTSGISYAMDDSGAWCDGTTVYWTGNSGTPGYPNAQCVVLP